MVRGTGFSSIALVNGRGKKIEHTHQRWKRRKKNTISRNAEKNWQRVNVPRYCATGMAYGLHDELVSRANVNVCG